MAQTTANSDTSLEKLDTYKRAINRAIEPFLDTMPHVLGFSPEALSVHSMDTLAKLREYTMRPGKRLRGVLAAAAYDDAKQTDLAEAGIALAVTQELIQSYILISDDVADRSELRRGKPTVHRELMAEGDAYRDEHEANMLAEYVGLVTEQIAYMALLEAPEHPEAIAAALHKMHANLTITGFGQIDDINQKVGRHVTEADILRVYMLKTGFYTFVNPLQTGLLLAGSTDVAVMQQIAEYGMAAGVAFQLHDDYLGVFGDSAQTGKPSVDDLKEGKYTMLVHYALEHAEPEDIADLRCILGSADITTKDVKQARRIFNTCGATSYAQTEARRYAAIARKRLDEMAVWSRPFKDFLNDLMDYAISRQA